MPEEGKRQVLNACLGMTNIIDEKRIDDVMVKTFESILEILSDYCGPYGKFAILTDPSQPTAQPTFTKDGLNIIRAIEFISPMENHVKQTMAYISQRVERSSGDGTTSTMIMVAAIMKALRKTLKGRNVSYKEFVDAYQRFSEIILEKLDEVKIKPKSKESIYRVALAQAMSSSHCNRNLANKVAELYSSTPQEAWNHIEFERERLETDDDFVVKFDDSDYSCDARIFDNKFYNSTKGDSFSIEDANIVISRNQLATNTPEFGLIIRALEDAIENDEKLVIIAPDGADPLVRQKIDELIDPSGNPNIGIFNLSIFNPKINDHVGILVTFQIEGIGEGELATIPNGKVTYKGGKLSVYGNVDKTEDMLHPAYQDKSSNVYKYLTMLNELVEEYKKSTIADNTIEQSIKDARRIYNAILLQKQGRIVIGGAAYDNQAMIDVVQDTMKATRAALLKGVVLGGYQSLLKVLNENDQHAYSLTANIRDAFIEGVDRLTECSTKHLSKSDKKKVEEASETPGSVFNVAIKCIRTLEDCLDEDACAGTVLQPVSVDKELIRRFGEVALKFMFTNRVIIPGGVVVEEEKGE